MVAPFAYSQPATSAAPTPLANAILKKHASQISALGFSTGALKSTLYLQVDLVNKPRQFLPFEYWLALVFEHPELVSMTAIKSGTRQGVLIKLKGVPSQGFLFRFEDGEGYQSHLVMDERAFSIISHKDAYAAALALLQLAEPPLPRDK